MGSAAFTGSEVKTTNATNALRTLDLRNCSLISSTIDYGAVPSEHNAQDGLAAMQSACAVKISLGQTDPAVAADMGPRPEQRLMRPGRATNKPVGPGDTAIFDTDGFTGSVPHVPCAVGHAP